MNRVKFYSTDDWTLSNSLRESERIINTYETIKSTNNINDIIELHNIFTIFKNGIFLKEWSDEAISDYKKIVECFPQIIGSFFNSINDENLINIYLSVDMEYRDNFVELFVKYKLYKRICNSLFADFISLNEVSINDVLKHQKLTKQYGKEIRNKITSNYQYARVILNLFEQSTHQYKIYLPDELTSSDINCLFQDYIASKEAHINLLEIIMNIRNNKRIKISDKTRLLAKQRIDVESDKIFETGVSLYTDYCVHFDSKQEEEIKVAYEERKRSYSYSKKWLEEHRDYETLLNNFIHLFNYADMQMRINIVSKKSELGVFESVAFIRSKDDYPSGRFFKEKLNTALLHLEAYYYELERMGILYEEIIEWFFEIYLEREFNVKDFTFKMPSKESTFLERARSLFPEIEAAIKQYKIYVEEGEINHELLEISSGSIRFEDVPSLVNNKYIYGNGSSFENIKFLLASNQSKLSHIQKSSKSYESFVELMDSEIVMLSDYSFPVENEMSLLQDKSIIEIDKNGRIVWKSWRKTKILFDLAINDVVNYKHYSNKFEAEFKELFEGDLIICENTLFSKPESDFISYILNKEKFSDGYDIRNKCEHGTQANSKMKTAEHKEYFFLALLIVTICMIKIVDDLTLKESN